MTRESEDTAKCVDFEDCFRKACESNDIDLKIKYYTKAIEFDPYNAQAHNCRGLAYLQQFKFEACSDFDKAIQLKLDFAEAYLNRGNFHYWVGIYMAAMGDYTKAMQLDPEGDIGRRAKEGLISASEQRSSENWK